MNKATKLLVIELCQGDGIFSDPAAICGTVQPQKSILYKGRAGAKIGLQYLAAFGVGRRGPQLANKCYSPGQLVPNKWKVRFP